jgi:hypothetical protein
LCGDANYTNQINNIDVEGIILTDPDGEDNFDEYTDINVNVYDGKLTIKEAAGASNAKICAIEIVTQSVVTGNKQEEEVIKPSFKVWPNPTTGQIFFNKEASMAQVMDVAGSVLLSDKDITSLDISGLNAGVYLLTLENEVIKIIKR